MDHFHRIQLYWPGRTDPRSALARQAASFLTALAPLHPELAHFLFHDKQTGLAMPADSPEACDVALERGTAHWQTGYQPRVSYEQRFYVKDRLAAPAAFTLTCGIEPLGLDAIWTPNRLELLVRRDADPELQSRAVLEGVMRAAVNVFKPDWGFAGSEHIPQAPLPVFSDGRPVVGWMTYLRAAFPEVPRTLPQPAVPYPVGVLGTLIVAHPEPMREGDESQRTARKRVEETLAAAGVLIPPERLRPAP